MSLTIGLRVLSDVLITFSGMGSNLCSPNWDSSFVILQWLTVQHHNNNNIIETFV